MIMTLNTHNNDALLLVDIGNSNLKWTWLENGQMSRLESRGYQADGVAAQAYHAWSHVSKPVRVIVANVAGKQVADQLQQWVVTEWGIEPEFVVATSEELGVKNAYREPGLLGVDRWLALIAAREQTQSSACVMDCGTAITIDVLSSEGQHQGGLILPGLSMMRQAMLDRTQIPRIGESDSIDLLAQDTAGAIAAGSLHAAAALVERVMLDLAASEGSRPRLILTGKDASRLNEVLKIDAMLEPELVMHGLALVAQK